MKQNAIPWNIKEATIFCVALFWGKFFRIETIGGENVGATPIKNTQMKFVQNFLYSERNCFEKQVWE